MMDNILINNNNNNTSGNGPTFNNTSLNQSTSANFSSSSRSNINNFSSLNTNLISPSVQHNNNNNNNNNNSRFSSLHSSPYLQDSSHMISFASLNVRGINNVSKFDSIMDDLMDHNLSVIGLQETKCAERNAHANFRAYLANHSSHSNNSFSSSYKAYWSYTDQDKAAGVGLIIAPFISKFVQKVHRFGSRFIAIDLYLPSKKLKIINYYAHQSDDYNDRGKHLIKYIIDHIKQASKDNFTCIILGDFNADPHKYNKYLEQGRQPPKHFRFIEFLTEQCFIEHAPRDDQGHEFATFYRDAHTPSSRIDLIWFPGQLLSNTFSFSQTWQLPSTKFTTDSSA